MVKLREDTPLRLLNNTLGPARGPLHRARGPHSARSKVKGFSKRHLVRSLDTSPTNKSCKKIGGFPEKYGIVTQNKSAD